MIHLFLVVKISLQNGMKWFSHNKHVEQTSLSLIVAESLGMKVFEWLELEHSS